MTRINIIPVQELFDQHLIAEYREITMVPAALNRTINSKAGLKVSKINKTFTLNKGHVYFFYNKGKYLHKRYEQIIKEMKASSKNIDYYNKIGSWTGDTQGFENLHHNSEFNNLFGEIKKKLIEYLDVLNIDQSYQS